MRRVSAVAVLCLVVIFSVASGSLAQVLPTLPRHETLIVDALHGRLAKPADFNIWKVGVPAGNGIQQMLMDALWYLDPQSGDLINALAAEPPVYNQDFTRMTVTLRKGIAWSDGVPFTADDVVFTVNYLRKHKGMLFNPELETYVNRVYKADDHAVVFELKKPNPSSHYFLTQIVYGTLYVMPRHVFEKVDDPLKFEYNPPVSLGPYTLKSFDPAGQWWLFERRQDWQKTSVGQLFGMPKPRYVLFIYYGPDEKKLMAQIQHQLDLIFDLTPEAWEVLRARNPYSRVWYKDFPWAWMDDVRARILAFNLERFPYNIRDVRWALALSLDAVELITAGFDGIGRLSPLHVCPTESLMREYYQPLDSWLREFVLEDGYKPWDPTAPLRLADYARRKYGVTVEEPRNVFGPGWWKYDPAEAEKLLRKHNLRRDGQGKWLLPDGKPWKITILAPAGFEIHATRLAFAVAEQWRKFGIDVTVNTVEAGPFWNAWAVGDFDVGSYWDTPATDIYSFIQQYHSRFFKPSGEATALNEIRWKNSKVDKIVDELVALRPEDPRAVDLMKEYLKVYTEDLPAPVVLINLKFNAQDHYYWTDFPSAGNPYQAPVWWWGQFKFLLPFIRATGRA